MKLTEKQINYIKRHAAEKSHAAIAKKLRIEIGDVERVLGLSQARFGDGLAAVLASPFRWGLLALALLAPFMFIKGLYDFANLPQMAFIQVGTVALLLLWIARGILADEFFIRKSPFSLPIAGFLAWALVSLAYAHNDYEGFQTWMGWAAAGLMFFLVVNWTEKKEDVNLLLGVVFTAGLLTALLGIFQHLGGFNGVPQVAPPAAVFANKNMAVHLIILTFPLALGFILNSKSAVQTWVVSIAAALMVSYLVYTRTRAGWLALAVEIVFFLVLLGREYFLNRDFKFWDRQKSLALVGAVLVAVIMINQGGGVDEIMKERGGIASGPGQAKEEETYTSILLRKDIWINTLEMIKDKPLLGFGLGNHKLYYPLYYRKVAKEKAFSETAQLSNVHNDFLQAFAELGVVGMFFLGWLAVLMVMVSWRLTGADRSPATRFQTIGIGVAILGLMVNACFSFPFQRAIPPFVLMIYIGLLSALFVEDGKGLAVKPRWLLSAAGLLVAVVLVVLGRYHLQGINCDRHYLRITGLEKAQNWPGVIYEGNIAFKYNPFRTKILSYVGRAQIESGKYREGIESLKQVIAAYPNHMNALLNIGVAYGSLGEFDEARKAYERVLEISPDYAKVHNNLGNLYMQQQKVDEAIAEFNQAAELDPQNNLIHFNVGIVEMQRRHYQEAAVAFAKSIAVDPNFALAQKNLGVVYFQFLGRQQEALPHFKRALELNPNIADAGQIRNLVGAMEGKVK